MKYTTKSIIIGRMKRKSKEDLAYPCFITMFDINDPHKSGKVPKKIVEFENIDKIIIDRFRINYLLAGNDIVINDLEYINIEKKKDTIIVSGKQG